MRLMYRKLLLGLLRYDRDFKPALLTQTNSLRYNSNSMTARLNVNIDHIATVRQARRAPEPSVVAAAMLCEQAGADGITVHLRGDRRHIQDADLLGLRASVPTYLNLEMAATEEMLKVALEIR